jgi:predicted RNase H-like HicB family nuclease
MKNFKDYPLHAYWDERAGSYVAEILEIPTCAADGPSLPDAVSNLEETFAVMKAVFAEKGWTMPEPTVNERLSVALLAGVTGLGKVSQLAKAAGIPGQTLATKLKRQTPFHTGEARSLSRALASHGIGLMQQPKGAKGAASLRRSKRSTPGGSNQKALA